MPKLIRETLMRYYKLIKSRNIPDGEAQLVVHILVIVTELVQVVEQEAVLVLCEVLAACAAVAETKLVRRRFVHAHFRLKNLFNRLTLLDTLFTALNLAQIFIVFCQLVVTFPEHRRVLLQL